MKNENVELNPGELRIQAEELLKSEKGSPVRLKIEEGKDTLSLVHELQVHQIELEMQNEELRRAKLEAEDAVKKYSDLYDFAPIGLFTLDEQGVIKEVNQAGAALLGQEKRNLLNRRFLLFVAPEDRIYFNGCCQNCKIFDAPARQACELRLARDEGPPVYVRIEGIVSKDCVQSDRQCRIAVIDITERKRAEEKLRESEERFRAVQENSLDRFTILKPFYDDQGEIIDFTYVYQNAQAARTSGRRPEELIGLRMSDIFPTFPQSRFFAMYKLAIGTGQVMEFEERYQADGVDDWFRATVTPIPDGIAVATQIITERKRAEDMLRYQSTLLANVSDAIIGVDAQLRVTSWNPAAERIYGYSADEVIGRTAKEVLRPEYIGLTREQVVEQLMMTGAIDAEIIHHTKDGRAICIDSHSVTLKDDQGRVIGSVGVNRDITERKRMEKALRRSEMRYRMLHESLRDPFVQVAMDGRIIDFNDLFCQMLGYSPEEVRRLTYQELTPERWHAFEEGIVREQIIQRGYSDVYEKEYRKKDGTIIPVELRTILSRDEKGHPSSMWGIVRDITERKRAEEALRESEERARQRAEELEKLMDVVPISIWVAHDPQCHKITCNQAASKLYEADLGENISATPGPGEPIPSRRFFRDGQELMAEELPVQEAAANGRDVLNSELEVLLPSGRLATVWGNASPLLDSHGQVRGCVGAFIDITERKQMEEELRKARDELELKVQERTVELSDANANLTVVNEELQVEILEHEMTEKELLNAKEAAEAAAKAKAAFMANMFHELRTPMNFIMGMTSLLLEEPLTPELKEYVEIIRQGGDQMMALVNNILDFSKAEKKEVMLERQPLSLRALVEESLEMVAPQAAKKNLNLAIATKYGTPEAIVGDHGKLSQVLVSLLSNAIKFTHEGEVSVSISSKTLGEKKRQILFEVRDTGIGIPPEKMGELFLPFSQVDMTTSRGYEGAGLGLAICKGLVDLMGGKIWAQSKTGAGSTFYFTVEAEIAPDDGLKPTMKAIEAIPETLAEKHPLAILIAEDEPSNQRVLVEMLRRMGYRADAVADGKEVLQSLQMRPYDLILMDLKMPEMDGLDATREIRKLLPDEKQPKIIAITAYAMEGDRQKCLDAGMDDYIAKPVQKKDLEAILMKYSGEPA